MHCRNIPHAGLSSSVKYQAFSEWKNYSEAHTACKEYNFKHPARINGADDLRQAKNVSGYDDLRKYWTALQVL